MQVSREVLAQLAPELVGREGESKEKGGGFGPGLGDWEGVGGRWLIEHTRLPHREWQTPDWELGERVGGLLKQPDPG